MYADSRKMHIIEAVLKVENEKILSKLEEVIEQSVKPGKRRSAMDYRLHPSGQIPGRVLQKSDRRQL
ncbi:hypothetical protein BH20BAC1_BH20BAC1_25550 [soil metagenome]